MILYIFFLIIGFVILIFGAEWLVKGASSLAKQFGLSELAIGLTVVAFGTSMPEFVVSAISSVKGANDVAFGNVLGSNIFNLLLILGAAGLITPLTAQAGSVWKETPFSLFCAILLFILVNDTLLWGHTWNGLGRLDGIILLIFFAFFLYYVFISLKEDEASAEIKAEFPESKNEVQILSNFKTYGFIAIGLAGLVGGGITVVESAKEIARILGMSEKLIGLTIVAAGTSLPELATSCIAAYKGKSDIAIGNVVGSNIFNILLILGLGAVINPTGYNVAMNFDLYVLWASTSIFFVMLLIGSGKKHILDRWEAGVMLAAYIGYTIYLIRLG